MISAIVAVDNNWGIGFNNDLLERIPEDLQRFKSLTTDNIIIMGRNTWDSLPIKPLPNRITIVITSNPEEPINTENAQVLFYNMEQVKDWLTTTSYDVFICGGESIYNQLLPYCDVAYVTWMYVEHENVDKYFPNIHNKKDEWLGGPIGKIKQYKDITYDFWTFYRIN